MALQRRTSEARDAIINMYVNGIAINAISRTLRIAPITIRKILTEWQTTVGAVAAGRARLTAAVEPACETVAKAVTRDDKAAFRLLEGMGVLGPDRTGAMTDKSISISVNTLLATTQPNAGDGCEQPSSRKGPTPQVQLQDGAQNFSEIPQLVDNKGDSDNEQSGQFTGESCGDGDDPSRE